VLRQAGDQAILLDHPLHVDLLDENDNPPRWNQSRYELRWLIGAHGRMEEVLFCCKSLQKKIVFIQRKI
jgi:hypothetical protein